MKKITIIISFLIFVSAIVSSCKKQIEVTPRQSVLIEQVFTSKDNINAAITGIYSRLKSPRLYGRDMFAVSDALSENGFATNKSGRFINETANVPGAHFVNWQSDYFAIAEINVLLFRIPSVSLIPAITTAERAAWEGQLYFLRAMLYHDLARTFSYEPGLGVPGQDRGSVPIVTFTPLTIETAIANLPGRSSADDVYKRIYADLDSSLLRLNNNNLSSPALPSLAAAQALYARVALYNRDYSRAVTMSSLSLTTVLSRMTSTSSYTSGWTGQVHPEALFELRFANPAENIGVNESLQTSYTTLKDRGIPSVVQGFGDLVATTTLLQQLGFAGIAANGSGGAFSSRSDDVRNLLFETGSTARGTARIECTKFIGKNGQANLDNIPLIRIPEVLLTRAEARANATNRDGSVNTGFSLTNAVADLVVLKQNRYNSYITTQRVADSTLGTSTNATPIIIEILRQRRLEFAMEGQRWFDFKRTNVITPAVGLLNQINTKVLYTDFRLLAPIPQREVDNNPNLIQNFGY
ncbi:MAG: RagB/SusD family nutrient uptake outer membrane protein [Ferruginibacter sp.]|nr:RagB/SusD family nutrient uptake outer membrane protein [Ferruginibacter sp.]